MDRARGHRHHALSARLIAHYYLRTCCCASTVGPMTSYRALARNRDFTRLWVGEAVSQLGTTATLFVFPLIGYALTGSALLAGLPGRGVHRSGSRSHCCRRASSRTSSTDAGCCWRQRHGLVLSGSLAVAGLLGAITMPHLVVVALGTGAVAGFYMPDRAVGGAHRRHPRGAADRDQPEPGPSPHRVTARRTARRGAVRAGTPAAVPGRRGHASRSRCSRSRGWRPTSPPRTGRDAPPSASSATACGTCSRGPTSVRARRSRPRCNLVVNARLLRRGAAAGRGRRLARHDRDGRARSPVPAGSSAR